MITVYILEIDNNLSYEDYNVNTSYFETYMGAYTLANYYSDNSYDYRILKTTINDCTTNTELLSAKVDGVWYHGLYDIMTHTSYVDPYEELVNPYTCSTFELYDIYQKKELKNNSSIYAIYKSIAKYNDKHAEEICGYMKFCYMTLRNYLQNEIVRCHEHIKVLPLTNQDSILYLYNKIDTLTVYLININEVFNKLDL